MSESANGRIRELQVSMVVLAKWESWSLSMAVSTMMIRSTFGSFFNNFFFGRDWAHNLRKTKYENLMLKFLFIIILLNKMTVYNKLSLI